jgi:hypothetical protein
MVDKESDIRPIGYGAMLMEGLVGIMSIIAASAMHPGDYFAINTSPQVFATLGLTVTNLPALESAVQETVAGRTGGAVSLAVGMAQIFAGLPGMRHLLDYWYHFAIMFEALFILTTIDTGTRVARFLVQELFGRIHEPWGKPDWMPGSFLATTIVVLSSSRRRRIEKTDESLIDDRFPQHLSARKATNPHYEIVCVPATAFDQLCNAIATQLSQRRIGRKATSPPRPFRVPIHLVARVFMMCDIRRTMSHRSPVCVRVSDEGVTAVKGNVEPLMTVGGP